MSPKAPPEAAAKLYAATRKIAQSPSSAARSPNSDSSRWCRLSSEQFGEIIAAEYNRNGESIRSLNIKP